MEEPETAEALRREIALQKARAAELKGALARAEQQIKRLERIIEVVPGAVWESEGTPGTPSYRMPFVSGEVERIFGYTREECLSRSNFWTSIVHPDDVPTVVRDLAAVATTGGRLSEYRFVTKDGGSVWVEAHITLNRDESGAIVGRCVVAADVTERVLLERSREELLARAQELTRRLDNVIGSVPGVVWEARRHPGEAVGEPIFVSDHFATLAGCTKDEIRAAPALVREVTHPDDRARVAREMGRIVATGRGDLSYRWLTRDGRALWVEVHARAVRDERGEVVGVCGVTMDITATKRAEEERERLKDRVLEEQEAALRELGTPIIPISAEILVMPLIGTIDAQRASRLTEALLDGIREARAKVAILDITGARNVGAETADALVRTARAVRLLGARVVLTGVTPEIAKALVALGADLESIATYSTLERGIAHARRRRRRRRL